MYATLMKVSAYGDRLSFFFVNVQFLIEALLIWSLSHLKYPLVVLFERGYILVYFTEENH
jgi:hypothetical protein